jgi:hypothetical protein
MFSLNKKILHICAFQMLISKFRFIKSMPVKRFIQIDLTIPQMTDSEPPQLHESQKAKHIQIIQ